MHVLRCLRLLCIFCLYQQILDAQEKSRFPLEFDNFNAPASWNILGTETWWRKLSFGIVASESWTLEFKIHLEALQGMQKLLVGLVNDSDVSICDNTPAQENLCIGGLVLQNKGQTSGEWIARPYLAGTGQGVHIPETCFLRFEYLSEFGARLTVFRDEELTDTVPGSPQIFRLKYPFTALNSFFIQFDPTPTRPSEMKAFLSELRFFNREALSFSILPEAEHSGEKYPEIELVPNPNRGIFSLYLPAEQHRGIHVYMEIYNSTGRIDYKLNSAGNEQQLQLSDARPGLYVLKLYLNGATILRKFIVY